MFFHCDNKGFTLIELLAVIVILAVISLIATPIVLGIIEESKKQAFIDTAYGLIDGAKLYVIKNPISEVKNFTIDSNSFVGDEIPMNGQLPTSGDISINPNMQIEIHIIDNKWCVYKTFEESAVTITEDLSKCGVESEFPVTADACFAFDLGLKTIVDYYDYQNNNSSNPVCPRDVVIPSTINGVTVTYVGDEAFESKNLNYVKFPTTIIEIGSNAFANNNISSIDLSGSIKYISSLAFSNNKIIELVIPYGVESIGGGAFGVNLISSVTIPNSVTDIDVQAFFVNNISTLTIPSSVYYIGNMAFLDNPIENLTIKGNTTNLPHRFDSNLSTIGFDNPTINYVTE